MPGPTKILVADDQKQTAQFFARILEKGGYDVDIANDGTEAYRLIRRNLYTAVVTDWLMPGLNGIELIEKTRQYIKPVPIFFMVTAKTTGTARDIATEAGADFCFSKPILPKDFLTTIEDILSAARLGDEANSELEDLSDIVKVAPSQPKIKPPFVAVAIASSTGGPQTLIEVFKNFPKNMKASLFNVQHGPGWMLESFPRRLSEVTGFKANIAKNSAYPQISNAYFAPGHTHIVIDSKTFRIKHFDGPKENYIKPAADPLFRSVAKAFGKYSIGVVLTGLGRDGSKGAAHIYSCNGKVIVQNPNSAIAPSMPKSAVKLGLTKQILEAKNIGEAVAQHVFQLSSSLAKA